MPEVPNGKTGKSSLYYLQKQASPQTKTRLDYKIKNY